MLFLMHSILELFSKFLGGTLIVSLHGDAKEAQSVVEGRYLLHESNKFYWNNYWIQENGSNAMWSYHLSDRYEDYFWIIGNQDDRGRGTQSAKIYSLDRYRTNPLLVSNWTYKASNGKWTLSDDVLVGPGNVDFDLSLQG